MLFIMEKLHMTCSVQKAFNTFDHQILFSKLEHYGIRGIPLNWFKSYLTKRRLFVIINNEQSETLLTNMVYLEHINDLDSAINYSEVHHFADDTNLLHSSKP